MATASIAKNNVHILGNPDAAETLVFTHGFGTDQNSWKDVVAPFKSDYRIVLYDNAGGGNSDPALFSANKYDNLYSYAEDLLDICRDLEITNAILIGHSVGSMISILAVLKEPSRFKKLVIIGASPRYRNEKGYIGGFEQSDLDALYQTMNDNYFAWVSGFADLVMHNADRPYLAKNFAESLSAIRPDIAQSVAKVIFQSDHRDVLGKLRIPTLVLQAKEDVAVPYAVAEYLRDHIAGSKMIEVNAFGHFPHISAPLEIVNAIRSFI
jgi:sigma-B regulation protein RsbQ